MIALLAAALAATPTPLATRPERQARATVRIVTAAGLRFARIEREHPQLLRASTVRAADGTRLPIRLVEFE